MNRFYLAPFILSAIIAGGLTCYVQKFALRYGLVDAPGPRKIHQRPTPRLGGVAIVLAFLIVTLGYCLASNRLDFSVTKIGPIDARLFGALIGSIILLIVGIIDDVKGMKPWHKLIFHFLAAIIVVSFGVSIDYLRLPGGNHLDLSNWLISGQIGALSYQIAVWGDLLTVIWLVLMINTLNFLDGLDGLAGGVAAIAGIALFILAVFLGQASAALLAVIFTGAVIGFLPWNFYPAKIFMGDSGSMFLGFILGVLAVISGGKLATAFLVLGLPLLDVVWVILRRIMNRHSPFVADRRHLHHRLLDIGLSQRQAVLILYLVSALFAVLAVSAGTQAKIQTFYYLLILMAVIIITLVVVEYKKRMKPANNAGREV